MSQTKKLLPMALATTLAMGCGTQALAADLTTFNTLTQAEFLSLSKDLAAATSGKAIEPATPLGITGFDISGTATVTQTHAGAAWKTVTGGSSVDQLPLTKLSITKGLPWGFDVGAFTAQVPTTNVNVTGFHAKYALIEGNAAMPAVALRAAYSKMGGVSQMDLSNTSYDLLISKGFLGLTPYAGVGIVNSSAKANGVATLSNESFSQNKTQSS